MVILGAGCSTMSDAQRDARDKRAELTPSGSWSAPAMVANTAQTASDAGATASAQPPGGGHPAGMARWWQRFDDPLLAAFIDEAQKSSPSVVAALSRVREARAQAQAQGAATMPTVTVGTDGARASGPSTSFKPATQATAGLQAQWELDLFGGLRHRTDAAAFRAEQARLEWHDARVTLAAEVASTYLNLRACEAVAGVLEVAATSQSKSAELTREKVRVGFEAPANGALALASAADASNRLRAQRADCEGLVLALSMLTGRAAQPLRDTLAARRATLPQPGQAFEVARVPASVLSHRPDIAAAERALAASESDVHGAQAARWPRITFGGTIGMGLVRVGGTDADGVSWSILPSLSLPLFDGGRITAGIDAARARRDASVANLDARVRTAVREIEDALFRLDAARARESDAVAAAGGFRDYFVSVEQRWRLGAASVIEMEEARRLMLNAQAALIGLQRDRVAAWIALYRATGGGWHADDGDASLPSARDRQVR